MSFKLITLSFPKFSSIFPTKDWPLMQQVCASMQVNAIDRLLTSAPHSEEFLVVLWELCAFARWVLVSLISGFGMYSVIYGLWFSILCRFNCGRQALLSLGYFPEVLIHMPSLK